MLNKAVVAYALTLLLHVPLPGRGQDTSSFLPKPEVILMADVVYYEQVIIIVLVLGSPPTPSSQRGKG